MKVNLKITFSRPRLVKEEDDVPHTLPNPVPLVWISIRTIRDIEVITRIIVNMLFIIF
jgi:hypothetical protein